MTQQDFLRQHVALLRASYLHWTGSPLIAESLSAEAAVDALMSAPFAVVSHDTQADPIFNYGNRRALDLFEMDWDSFTRLPSRLSAEAAYQQGRGKSLDEVSQRGYVQGYSGSASPVPAAASGYATPPSGTSSLPTDSATDKRR
jgi:hypothetical protein